MEALGAAARAAAAVDFAVAIDAGTTLPAGTVVSDGVTQIPIKVDVTNGSGIASSGSTRGTIAIVAHREGDGAEFSLGSFPVDLGALGAGKMRKETCRITIPLGMESGSYQFIATLTTVLPSDTGGNNSASTDDAGLTPVTISQGVINLTDGIAGTTIPEHVVEGKLTRGTVSVTVTNLGNIALPKGAKGKIEVAVRPADAVDGSADQVIGTLTGVGLGGLTGGKTFKVPVTLPLLLGTGGYVYVATVTPPAGVSETTLEDNSTTGGSLSMEVGAVDVAISDTTNNFPETTTGGSSANEVVRIKNLGNMPTTGAVTVQLLLGTGEDIGSAQLVATKSIVVHLDPGETAAAVSLKVTLPPSVDPTTYTIFARILPTGLADTEADDNVATVGTVTAQPAFVDLRLASASVPFADGELAGGIGTGTAVVQNAGSRGVVSQVTVTYYASTTGSVEGAIPIGSKTVNMSLAAGASSAPINVNLTLPTPPSDTSYRILAKVSSTSLLDSDASNDVTDVLKTVVVSHFRAVFPPAFGDTLTFLSVTQQVSGGTMTQKGTFQTNKSTTGTYTFTVTTAGSVTFISLSLKFNTGNGQTQNYATNPVYLGPAFMPGDRIIRFGFDSAEAGASMLMNGSTVYLHLA
jgi:hypothetical protein